jgi:hypothetical protein
MRGAITPLPHTSSWHGAKISIRKNITFSIYAPRNNRTVKNDLLRKLDRFIDYLTTLFQLKRFKVSMRAEFIMSSV